MTPSSRLLPTDVAGYIATHSSPPDAVQRRLIEVTRHRTGDVAEMQIGTEQAAFLELLTRAMGVTSAIEIGTFTGYSALAIARGLAPGGRLRCCDVSEEWTEIAREHWAAAGVADRIELSIGPALDTLAALPDDETFDLAFVDADKPNYANYLAELVPRLRPHGVVLVDNTLWAGRVIGAEDQGENTVALRAFNDEVVARDDLLVVSLLPIGDGVTMIGRRPG